MSLLDWDLIHKGQNKHWGGIDEAGRGTWAGPVVSACVVLSAHDLVAHEELFKQVNDSKQLTKKRREALYDALMGELDPCSDWSLGIVHAPVIDEINILQATKRSMREAVVGCETNFPPIIFVDGNQSADFRSERAPIERTIVKGDGTSCAIACASIIAKVWRDSWMAHMANEFPGYGFENHSGYGTAAHREALERLGPCTLHRMTFSPMKELFNEHTRINQGIGKGHQDPLLALFESSQGELRSEISGTLD